MVGASLASLPLRQQLSLLPRLIHRILDGGDVYRAAVLLLVLIGIISAKSPASYHLADALAKAATAARLRRGGPRRCVPRRDRREQPIFEMVQRFPKKIHNRALQILEWGGGSLSWSFGNCAVCLAVCHRHGSPRRHHTCNQGRHVDFLSHSTPWRVSSPSIGL